MNCQVCEGCALEIDASIIARVCVYTGIYFSLTAPECGWTKGACAFSLAIIRNTYTFLIFIAMSGLVWKDGKRGEVHRRIHDVSTHTVRSACSQYTLTTQRGLLAVTRSADWAKSFCWVKASRDFSSPRPVLTVSRLKQYKHIYLGKTTEIHCLNPNFRSIHRQVWTAHALNNWWKYLH